MNNICRIFFASFIFFGLFVGAGFVSAQDSIRDPLVVGVKGNYGFIIPHSSAIKEVSFTKPRGVQVDMSRLRTSIDSWMNCHCYARTGLTFSYYDFAYPDILGASYSGLFFVEPIIADYNKLYMTFRAGLGLTYLTQVYDEETNPKNMFFSMPLSFAIHLNMNVNYRVTDNLSIVAGGFFNHISNANIRQPNKGMNFPTATLGLDYFINPVALENRHHLRSKELYRKKNRMNLELISTVKTVHASKNDFTNDKNCFMYGLSGSYSRVVSSFSALGGGIEWVNDGYVKEKIRRENVDSDYKRVSLLLGHDLLIGDFEFSQFIGVYLYAPYEKQKVLQRYKLIYRFNEHLYAGISLKAYLQVADNLEFRLGYTF